MPRIYNMHHKDAPKRAVYIGRKSKWGNPFTIGVDGNRDEVIQKYSDWLHSQPNLLAQVQRELKGKDLVCFCYPAKCHGDILMQVANDEPC